MSYLVNIVWSEEDKAYIARIPEFSGLTAFGDTPEEAKEEAMIALAGFIEMYKKDGEPLPIPKG